MKKTFTTYILSVIALFLLAATASADIKVKTKTTTSGQSFEGTTYIKKSRQRTESNVGGMSMATITQCDLRRMIQLNDKARTYFVMQLGGDAAGEVKSAAGAPATSGGGQTRRGGVVTFVYKATDTGERKQMFGMTARHLKVSMTSESSPDACNPSKMRMDIDGWYVDLDYGLDCEMGRPNYSGGGGGKPDCVDEYRTKILGVARLGYALQQTTIIYGDTGAEMSRMTTEVLELSSAPLDAALFDIPAGYTEAKSMQEFYASAAMSSMPSSRERTRENEKMSMPRTDAATETAATAAPAILAAGTPKKPGAVRVGIVTPSAKMSGGVPPETAAEAVRNTFAGFIKGTSIEVVALVATDPDVAFAEAKQNQCDYVLFSGLTQKKGGGMFGKIAGGIASTAGSAIPYGGSAGEVAARTAVYTTATIATSVKAKDEVSLEYRLYSINDSARPLIGTTEKAKAKSDGEDVITPLVERASQAIVATVRK
jgi:hypothetical protein